MRWRAKFYNKVEVEKEVPENYGLKSFNCPRQIKGLSALENGLFNLSNIIKFGKVQSELQRKLKEDIKLINSESKTLTFPDETTNLYKLEKEQCNKLLKDSITTAYKKVNRNIRKLLNLEGKKHCKRQNYRKQNPSERPRWMFYISKRPQTKLYEQSQNKAN